MVSYYIIKIIQPKAAEVKMADEIKKDFFEDEEIYTLTDEEGKEQDFQLLGTCEIEGVEYLALVPVDENETNEYVILKVEKDENGEDMLVTIDDDEEFDRVADIFEDNLFDEVDYDGEEK